MEVIIISNTCVGAEIYKHLNIQYTSPFIGTLIPNDIEYIKLCNNVKYFLNIEPIFNFEPKDNTPFAIQNNGRYYKHSTIKTPYPIIHLDDVEIHCIHDNMDNVKIKWCTRMDRARKIISNNNYVIFNCLAISEFLNNHDNLLHVINNYINNEQDNVYNLFIGPNLSIDHKNYIVDSSYTDNIQKRDSSHVPINNNQDKSGTLFTNYIKQINSM